MKKIIPLLLVFALVSCNPKNSYERLKRRHLAQIEASIESDSTKGEDFQSFLEQFKKDTLFQQERAYLPFRQVIRCYDEAGGTHDSIIIGNEKEDWPLCSFLAKDSISYLHQDIKVKKDTVVLALSMDQSSFDSRAIRADFIRKNGKWSCFLIEIVSYCME